MRRFRTIRASKTATVTKPGAEVRVTVGKPEVIINGESRPLDVPPIVYQGDVLVPVRVISEGMGAYVQWVPDRRLVVVRYVPATPPPTEAPPPPPAAAAVAPPPPPPPTPNPLHSTDYFRSYLLHPSECVEQSGHTVQLHAGRQVQLHRRQSGELEQRDRAARRIRLPGWAAGTSAATYLYANPIDGPCFVRGQSPQGQPSASRKCRRTPTPTIRCPASP